MWLASFYPQLNIPLLNEIFITIPEFKNDLSLVALFSGSTVAESEENSKEINADSSTGTTRAMQDDARKQDEATSSNDDGFAAAAIPVGPSESTAADANEEGATASAKVDAKEESIVELPFQVQIRYTDLDGNKALRVLTETRLVTNQREVAEKRMFAHML